MGKNKNKKNQNNGQEKKQEAPKQQEGGGPAPRRRGRRRRAGKNNQPQQQAQGRRVKQYTVKSNPKVTLGEGVRSNIMELVPIEPSAVECFYLPLISNAITMGVDNVATPIYWAFIAAITDLINILTSEVNFVSNRLVYLNEILAAYVPKTLPFKTGTISYSWSQVLSAVVSSVYTIRNYKYAMYQLDGGTNGTYNTMVAPPAPTSPNDTLPVYAAMLAQIANNQQSHLKLAPDATLKGPWRGDASPYSQCSQYYGDGNTPDADGPAYSAELEIPKKSTILTGMTTFSAANGRVARVFSLSSGGSACAAGLAFLPKWDMKLYNTAYPVQYCFLDLDEVNYWMQQYYLQLVAKSINTEDPNVNPALAPFSCTPQQWRIALRQAILSFFANSQNLSQFMTYSSNTNGFEPFRTGTNCAALNRLNITMPELLVENMRLLLATYLDVPTKFHNDKNQMIFVPVWGLYKAVVNNPPNLQGTLWLGDAGYGVSPLFTGQDPYSYDPNPIDGFDTSGNCCDLNCFVTIDIINEWNQRVAALKTPSAPTTYLTGSSKATLLTYTRFCSYVSGENFNLSRITPFMRRIIPKEMIKEVEIEETVDKRERSVTRNPSKEGTVQKIKRKKEVYIPPNASLYTQETRSFSSLGLITQEAIQLMNYFIFPTIVVEPTQPPSQKQVRSATTQSYIYDLDNTVETATLSARGFKLQEVAKLCAPGIAAQETDELMNVVKTFAEQGKGGFVADLIGAVAQAIIPF